MSDSHTRRICNSYKLIACTWASAICFLASNSLCFSRSCQFLSSKAMHHLSTLKVELIGHVVEQIHLTIGPVAWQEC